MTTLITGGAGFLGRGIMKLLNNNEQYIVYSRDETKQDLCKRKFPDAEYVLGDVKDYDRLRATLIKYNVQTIIHTAAIKYIPEAEFNVNECIAVNVEGSQVVARAALDSNVERVVGISTDKAVHPANVYGATKMLMERTFSEYATIEEVWFTLTRYGNVVGSTGSVIPLFQHQLESVGRITLTDPNMTRFWISISQAVQLIAEALGSDNGQIVVPKAQAMRMDDLAGALVGSNDKIDVVGRRPGEKIHESLLTPSESLRAIDCGDHYRVGEKQVNEEEFMLTSGNPQVWLNAESLRAYIKEAECI